MCLREGVVAVPGGAGGFLLGGILVRKLSMTTREQLRVMFFVAIVGLGTMLLLTLQCDTAPIADMSLHQRNQYADK